MNNEAPSISRSEARDIFLCLDGVTGIRKIGVDRDDDSCEDGPVFFWHAEVLVCGRWLPASIPDHWPDGAEIHY